LYYNNKINKEENKKLYKIAEIIKEKDNFLITAHVNSDGDSISSILLLNDIVKQFGKKAVICIDDNVPEKFDFLPGTDNIVPFDELKPFTPDVTVVLDASNLHRTGRVQSIISRSETVLSIDHHGSNDGFGTVNFVDSNASSTVEIVYRLINILGIDITKEMALYVYNGIVCDTGSFSFPNTTEASLAICADMVHFGVEPGFVAKNLYQRSSPDTLRALAASLSTLEFHFNGKVGCMHLANGFVSKGNNVDTEGFVDYLLSVEGTEVEFFMIEENPGYFRVSLRSKEYVDVNKVAGALGGGGHPRAAGCRISGNVDDVKEKILNILKSYV